MSRRPMPCLPSVLPPRRPTADSYRAAPPLHTHTPDLLLDRVCVEERTEPPVCPAAASLGQKVGPECQQQPR